MKRLLGLVALVIGMMVAFDTPSVAQPTNPQQMNLAQTAAEGIINSLGNQHYKELWDSQISAWFKKKTSEDAFLANMAMGRAQFGVVQNISLVSGDHFTYDPANDYHGDIYSFTFRDKYSLGDFFERIVVIKDVDGIYRLAGLFGAAVPKGGSQPPTH